jgi:hypothetical protein
VRGGQRARRRDPPENATYARTPARAAPIRTVSPLRSTSVAWVGAASPLTVTGTSAPVTAMAHGASTPKRGPISVHSSPAAPSALPTRRLAITNARTSIGPEGGMPWRS